MTDRDPHAAQLRRRRARRRRRRRPQRHRRPRRPAQVVATAPVSGAADVDAAYAAAATAFEALAATPRPSERQQALLKIADAIEARADELRPARGARTPASRCALTASEEIPPMVDQIRFFAGAARVLEGRSAGEYMAGHTSLDPPRADRRHRPGDAVELPDDDGGLEVRPRARGRQHRRAQAERHHAGDDAAAGRDRRRVPAAGRASTSSRGDRDTGRRAGRAPDPADGRRSPARCGPGMQVAERGRARPQAGAPRARRQGAGDRLRRRRHRGGRRGDRGRRLLQRRPGLHRRHPGARRRRGIHDDFVAALAEQAKARQGRPAGRRGRRCSGR